MKPSCPDDERAISLEQAILETLAYSDVFDFPLHVEELHRYLRVRSTLADLQGALARGVRSVACCKGFYFLNGREALVPLRMLREACSRPALLRARHFGRILGRLPFIRMVALTGSLALLNADETADLDYMLVARQGRVWTARGFALLFGRLTARRGYTLCPNLIVSARLLAWPQRDLYTAREICQMIPITGLGVYDRLRQVNDWTDEYLPNASGMPPLAESAPKPTSRVQSVQEWALQGALGDRVEAWEMVRKIRRFERQAGFGAETHFDADTCQGNFHHHGAHTRQALQERLVKLGIESALAPTSSHSL